jgi:hypothetical protein
VIIAGPLAQRDYLATNSYNDLRTKKSSELVRSRVVLAGTTVAGVVDEEVIDVESPQLSIQLRCRITERYRY